jgi:hypothetical protein
VHYGDFRHHPSLNLLKYVAYVIQTEDTNNILYPQAVISHFRTSKMFKQFVDACVLSDNFVQTITDIFDNKAPLYFDKEHLTSSKQNVKSIHRIRKQILKLPSKMQQSLVKFHKKQCNLILQDQYNTHYRHARSIFLKKQSYDIEESDVSNNLQVLYSTIHSWLFHLMDIYILARMMYYFENEGSKNIVVYTGTKHIYNYQRFFNQLKYIELWFYDKQPKMQKRCVQIPVDIIKDMIHNSE